MGQQLSTNTFGTAKWIVDASASQGTHTTIAAALTSASSGDTIFIRPGTYTEDLTLKAGVNLTAYECDDRTPNVIILGKTTASYTGTATLSGICLRTNSDFCIVLSGANNCKLYLINCFINALNNTAISFTNSNGSSLCEIQYCQGDISTTGIAYFSKTGPGVFRIIHSNLFNSGGSTTDSSITNSGLDIFHSVFQNNITNSAAAAIILFSAIHAFTTSSTGTIFAVSSNLRILTLAGTGISSAHQCYFSGATSSAISIGTGTTLNLTNSTIFSSNTNAITGAGTLNYGTIDFVDSTKTIDTTTQSSLNGATFTPVLTFGGGSTGITYTTQSGQYTRTGNTVFFSVDILLSNKGSSTGAAALSLPFTARAGSPNIEIFLILLTVTTTGTYTSLEIAPSGTTGAIVQVTASTGTAVALTDVAFANTSVIRCCGTYFI